MNPYMELIQDEVNVKNVYFSDSISAFGNLELQVNGRVGSRLGSNMRQVIASARQGDWQKLSDGRVDVAGYALEPDEFSLRLQAHEGVVCQVINSGQGVVVLDVNITKDLENEGIARDLVRLVQMTRKAAELKVSDRIHLSLSVSEDLSNILAKFQTYICHETLAENLTFDNSSNVVMYESELKLQGQPIKIALSLCT
jgi:isoleucyl-tRNA synthetase